MQLIKILHDIASNPEGRLTTYRDRHRIASLIALLPISLPRVLKMFGSDKHKHGHHNYGPAYERLFQSLRYRKLKILEIGVLAGDSLLAWRAFFPRAITVGLDVDDKSSLAIGKRTRIYHGSQAVSSDLDRLCAAEGPFDIVIDDGSHRSVDQLFTFERLFPHLRNGGLYVIEDVQTSFWSGVVIGMQWDGSHIDDPRFANTCFGWFLDLAKYLNHAEFETLDGVDSTKMQFGRQIGRIVFEHNIIAVWKCPNNDPSNCIRRASL
jgi:hypothetical protein